MFSTSIVKNLDILHLTTPQSEGPNESREISLIKQARKFEKSSRFFRWPLSVSIVTTNRSPMHPSISCFFVKFLTSDPTPLRFFAN